QGGRRSWALAGAREAGEAVGAVGREFVTAFMQNYQVGYSAANLSLRITSLEAAADVSVSSHASGDELRVTVAPGQTETVVIPASAEVTGSDVSERAVVIRASQDVAVLAVNAKPNTAEVTQVFPLAALGTEYFVLTPPGNSAKHFRQFVVVAGPAGASVDVLLTGSATFRGTFHPAGSRLAAALGPYGVAQVQSTSDLSGSRVTSNRPVAVLSGNTCVQKHTSCNHVTEQLLPTASWGTTFVVPPASFQSRYDLAYVVAARTTELRFVHGGTPGSQALKSGQVVALEVRPTRPLLLEANAGIQVLLFGAGGARGAVSYDPYLALVPPVTSYCSAYVAAGLPGVQNLAVLVAPAADVAGVTLDGEALGPGSPWTTVPGSDFSYAEVEFGPAGQNHALRIAQGAFGLLTIGLAQATGFGTGAACGEMTSEIRCTPQCRPQEHCELVSGKPSCVADSSATCRAEGDPHYWTFDGLAFDFMGTCTYTLAEICGDDESLPAFSVEAKNDNRGSKRVSYVNLVTVRAYSQIVSLARGEHGFARINNQRSLLPVSLHDGRLRVFQSGNRGVVEADFGLRVTFDWDNRLSITLPSSFWAHVCGLCGNYNGNPGDDMATPDGTPAANPVEFGRSWKLADGDRFCWDECPGGPPTCSAGQVQDYSDARLCGLLRLPDGPFGQCHAVVAPDRFLDNCVYDLCVSEGDRPVLCQGLEAYAEACRDAGAPVSDWRTPAGCPYSCPANSRYEACGSACPATCSDQTGPAPNCSLPCVETCRCLAGFVLSGGRCVARSDCGCVHQGRPLAPGEQFWGDDRCQQRCQCDGKTGQVSCRAQGCLKGERCTVQNGLRGCYPIRFGSCSASGDPHYISFDGRRFDFMGTCVYLFAGLCQSSPGLQDFQVLVENEHRGSQTVSYTRAVRVKVYGLQIAVRREHPGRVLVDGLLQYLPHQTADGRVDIFRQGEDAVIRTDFGLTVTYDWKARVTVRAPSSYEEALCGLCGNYNGDPQDDLLLRGGGPAPDPTAFGQSWREETVPGCSETSPGSCPDLNILMGQQQQSGKQCGILVDTNGPFRGCHGKVDPQGFFRDCVYDTCLLPGRPGVVCEAVAAYVAACHAAGATVTDWRSDTFCPLTCPANSHYELCVRGCPSSCGTQLVPGGCGSQCQEGCACDDGYLLNGETCVRPAQCGCSLHGSYYPPGSSFVTGPDCAQQCSCTAGGQLHCTPASCGPHEKCGLSGGAWGCVVVGSATCSASGDPHYTSFDGRRFDFMGDCTYVLARSCGERPGLQAFAVFVQNVKWGNGRVSVTRLVALQTAGVKLVLEQNQRGLVKVRPGRRGDQGILQAAQQGADVVIQTDFGLRVTYDLVYHVRVKVPGNYHGQVCGLCGDYNGVAADDFRLPDGQTVNDPTTFGASWEVPVPGSSCTSICPGGSPCPPETCPPALEDNYKQNRYCGLLTDQQGPLAPCHAVINPEGYFKDCVFDLCLGGGNESILCDSVHAYVSACQAAGVTVGPWRSDKFCPMRCPANSHYELCAHSCSTSCAALDQTPNCPGFCSEGCQCDPGFLAAGPTCVPLQDCGCFEDGRYYEPNEDVLVNNCHDICTCRPGQGLTCRPHSCPSDHVCEAIDGALTCTSRDPCRDVTCRDQETCKDGVCVPDYSATCWLWGDPHYQSFDGRAFDFQGTCSYLLAAPCGPGAAGLPAFAVTTKNENRGHPSVSYARSVTVSVYGLNVSVHKGEFGAARVNGVRTTLPVTLAGGQLTVKQGPGKAVVDTAFGLSVTYDWNWRVEVTLPSSYHDAVCGLCGDFDGDKANDLAYPNGTLAASIPSWGGSWRVPDRDPFCWDECHGHCPTCSDDQKQKYEGPSSCGVLTAAPDGPFSACHRVVSPDSFFDGCVYDVCLGGGAQDILCQALAAYAAACQQKGVPIDDWRSGAGCALACPENSHYELCGSSCPASCSDRTPPAPCPEPCAEGCQCDAGHVLSGAACVPLGGCGCSANGTYYPPGTEFWGDESCRSRCRCDPERAELLCGAASCGPGEVCSALDGVLGCHPASLAVCQAYGDPHYVTFDGRRYDFQGGCDYLLSGLCRPRPGLEPFQVVVANRHRASRAVTYTRTATLHVYNHSFALSQEFPRRMQVDGAFVDLPFQLDGRLRAYISGKDVVVATAFGLQVTFDGDSLVRVSAPSPYTDSLCGLCSNYNGDPSDDLTLPNGTPTPDPSTFGNSWQVGGGPECASSCPGGCPVCSKEEQDKYRGPEACGVISQPDGPLRACHGLVDPSPFFSSCLLDACEAQGHPSVLCSAVAAYVTACQAAGAKLEEWRRPDFCPASCSPNSHYELCGDSCPSTCADLSGPAGCRSGCREGCVCDSGFVLSGTDCVPLAQCGCVHLGRYYPLGQTFYPGSGCEQLCECGLNGEVSCQERPGCGPHEECRLEAGVPGCHPKGCGRCVTSAGAHFITYDGRVFDFHGSCSYVLSQLCPTARGLQDFSVILEKDAAGDTARLLVTVAGHRVVLGKGQKASVDGEAVSLPLDGGALRLTAEGQNVVLQATLGLRILYDGDALVLLSVPSTYWGQVCGLCGNFNGNWSEDFRLPGGAVTTSVQDFGASWKAPGSAAQCGHGCGPGGCRVCSAAETAPYEVPTACGMLRDVKGPFGDCHGRVNPSEYFRQCVYDLCQTRGAAAALCRSLQAYTAVCQAAGASVQSWRRPDLCPPSCPSNGRYSVCMRSCESSCSALSTSGFCSPRCFEGCQCRDGFLLSQGACVPVRDCGCLHRGRYLPVNGSLLSPDCSERCRCTGGSGLRCAAAGGCGPDRVCQLHEGSRTCRPWRGLCSLAAGNRLTSFDGARGAVVGSGTYELSAPCRDGLGAWFRVLVGLRHNPAALTVGTIFFRDGVVTVTRQSGVWVNGRPVSLPARVLAGVSVSRSPDGSLVVQQAAGVRLRLRPNGELDVTAPDALAGALCGLCGNLDGDKTNDLQEARGKKAVDDEQGVMSSWRAEDFSTW
uniref:VWFD domain-containing protein n=1 Tax=Ornithorhynchus anatinus TaxID=9258 RepID=A0A6I8NET5_ORNAN